ncbi:serine/threonine-protein kinase HAL4/sat4 [Geranomyces variabilis]|nr:serine/threonine-protein kinase HAL4/sat4 [Geranomyces variabilis]
MTTLGDDWPPEGMGPLPLASLQDSSAVVAAASARPVSAPTRATSYPTPPPASGKPPPAPAPQAVSTPILTPVAVAASALPLITGKLPSSQSPTGSRRSILYRIFHIETDHEPGFSKSSLRSGSGSEHESEHSDEDPAVGGSLDRPRQRQGSITESTSSGKPRSGMFTMKGSSDEGSGSDADVHIPAPKRQPSRSHLAEWFNHHGHGKDAASQARSSNGKVSSDDGAGSGSGSDADRPAPPKRSPSRSSILADWLHASRKPKSQSAPNSPYLHPANGAVPPNVHPFDTASDKSSDSDVEARAEHSHNLFKDLIMHAKGKKGHHMHHGTAGKAAEGPSARAAANPTPSKEDKPSMVRSLSENSLAKYGRREDILGKGANAVVRLCCPADSSEKKLAVKEFRKRRKNETQKEYVKKLISEFCISSTLHHENVVTTVDLIQDEKHQWCVVMDYCAGGDLFERIRSGSLKESGEVNCYLKQLVQGVNYLHSMGVAHRDLKPENLLLDQTGRILKITDFGVSEVFRNPFCSLARKAKGLCGSGPYIAPEEFETGEYDSEQVDVWSIGIIYYVMVYNSIPWKAATPTDPRYKHYLENKGKFWPLDRMQPGPRKLMYRILDPNPATRITMKEVEEDEWFKSLKVCHEDTMATEEPEGHHHVCTSKLRS